MTVRTNPQFTYQYLKDFLKYARDIAPIFPLREWNGQRGIILRHDVDFDIYLAHQLSKIEKILGIRSTFFVMTTCFFYNPLSSENRKILADMANDGFEIGLHFDLSVYGDVGFDELSEKVNEEAGILESIINNKIASISLHNPSIGGKYPIFEGYNNAYSKEIFTDEYYLSDSCFDFKGKDPYEFIKRAGTNPVQVVFHPMHWSDNEEDYIEIVSKFILRNVSTIHDILSVNPTYKIQIAGRRLEEFIKEGG